MSCKLLFVSLWHARPHTRRVCVYANYATFILCHLFCTYSSKPHLFFFVVQFVFPFFYQTHMHAHAQDNWIFIFAHSQLSIYIANEFKLKNGKGPSNSIKLRCKTESVRAYEWDDMNIETWSRSNFLSFLLFFSLMSLAEQTIFVAFIRVFSYHIFLFMEKMKSQHAIRK